MPDEMPTQWRDWRKGVGFALDVLGVYLLPLCCLILDYAWKWLGTALYPFTLWTFAATGMIAFALSRRATGDRRTTNLAVGALSTTGIGAGIIGLVLLDSVTRGWPVNFTGPTAAVAILTADRTLERASALLEKARWSSAVAAAGAASVIVPTGLALLLEISGDQRRTADLRSGDRERVLRALSPDSWYGPRDVIGRPTHPHGSVCRNVSALPLDDPAVETAARLALGLNQPFFQPNLSVHEYCGPPQ